MKMNFELDNFNKIPDKLDSKEYNCFTKGTVYESSNNKNFR